ncbi:MAG: divalent metal cation transporter [Rubrobacter sp.]|nr:divalent metal cation transporter [Rubrobacter sp.]
MLIQAMSAKLGIATGKNLPEVCRAHFPKPLSIGLWIQAEIIAMATDLAGVHWSGSGPEPALRHPAVSRRSAYRVRRFWHPRAAAAWF